jgi:hypothetical protein
MVAIETVVVVVVVGVVVVAEGVVVRAGPATFPAAPHPDNTAISATAAAVPAHVRTSMASPLAPVLHPVRPETSAASTVRYTRNARSASQLALA